MSTKSHRLAHFHPGALLLTAGLLICAPFIDAGGRLVTQKAAGAQRVGTRVQGSLEESCLIRGWLSEWALDPMKNSWLPGREGQPASKATAYADVGVTPGNQRVELGNFHFEKENLNLQHAFFAAGEKVYETGTMCGAFLRRGYLYGDETGVWSMPYKMLDGVFIDILPAGGETIPLINGYRFENHFAYMDLFFRVNGLEVVRRDFAPVSEYAFFYTVRLKNLNPGANPFTFRFGFQENIRTQWGKKTGIGFGKDTLEQMGPALFKANDERIPDAVLAFGSPDTPTRAYKDTRNPYRNRGIFEYGLELGAGEEREFTFLACMYDKKKMAGPANRSTAKDVLEYYAELRGAGRRLLDQKVALYKREILGGPMLQCPDKQVERAFTCAKWNLRALHLDIRPYHAERYIMTAPTHGYSCMFGIDPLYCSIGATTAGFEEIAKETYLNMLHYAKDYGYGGIPYIVDVWGGATPTFGRAQENNQYIATVWEHAKITGDRKFCEMIYPHLRTMFKTQQGLDSNGNYWPEGMTFPGPTESVRLKALTGSEGADAIDRVPPEFRNGQRIRIPEGQPDVEMISAAVRACWAARNMAEMAEALGRSQDAKEYRNLYERMRARFQEDWWMAEKKIWATGLANFAGQRRQILLSDMNKVLLYPQIYGIADPEKGITANETFLLKSPRVRSEYKSMIDTWGASFIALACYNYGQADPALHGIMAAAWVPTEYDHMLGAIPLQVLRDQEVTSSSMKMMYSWSVGPLAEAIVRGLLGVQGNYFDHTVVFTPHVPEGWSYLRLLDYRLGKYGDKGQHLLDFVYEKGRWTVRHKQGPVALRIAYDMGEVKGEVMLAPGETKTM